MNIQSAISVKCDKCKIAKRKGRLYVICPNARHKQRQG